MLEIIGGEKRKKEKYGGENKKKLLSGQKGQSTSTKPQCSPAAAPIKKTTKGKLHVKKATNKHGYPKLQFCCVVLCVHIM